MKLKYYYKIKVGIVRNQKSGTKKLSEWRKPQDHALKLVDEDNENHPKNYFEITIERRLRKRITE
jgi:hypothetical protein